MFMRKLGVAAVLVLCAFGASASNFRGADQVYVPIAGHSTGQTGTFISDVYVSNLSGDPVSVSVIFQQFGDNGGTGTEFKDVIQLRGFERKEFLDFYGSGLGKNVNTECGGVNCLGQLIFNACRQGQDCGPASQDADGNSPHYRPITVQSRIYQIGNVDPAIPVEPNRRRAGQLFSGIPWYHFVSSLQSTAKLDKVFITGIRQTGGAGSVDAQGVPTFRTNIGLVNASQYSSTTMRVTLFQGTMTAADQKGVFERRLGPLGNTQVSMPAMFPNYNFTATPAAGTNLFVVVEQFDNTPTQDAPASCVQGCPAFFAYGALLDNVSGDAITLEAQYLEELSPEAIAVIYPSGSGKAGVRRSVRH
jgi:hypothetical protein